MARVGGKLLQEITEEQEWELPISMIDVVFLLLIFFILASKFRQVENRLEANLPKDEGPKNIKVELKEIDEVLIRVTASDTQRETYPIIQVRKREFRGKGAFGELEAFLKGVHGTKSDQAIVIQGKPDVPFWMVVRVLDACAFASLTNVKFQAPPAELDQGGKEWAERL